MLFVWFFVVAFVLLPATIRLWIFAVPVYKAYRMRRAGAAADSTDTSRQLPRRESMSGASPEERVAAAARRLREARLTLLSAQALLTDAASRSKWDIVGLSLDRGRDKQSSFGAAVRSLRNAEDLANDAFALLKGNPFAEPLEFDTSPVLWDMDTAWLTDGLIPNVAMHIRIERARTCANRMLERVEASLAGLHTREPIAPASNGDAGPGEEQPDAERRREGR
jgi:hypothetical protein